MVSSANNAIEADPVPGWVYAPDTQVGGATRSRRA